MVEVLNLKDKSTISSDDIIRAIAIFMGHIIAARMFLEEENIAGASGALQLAASAISDLYLVDEGSLFSLDGTQNVMIIPQYAEHVEEYLANADRIIAQLSGTGVQDPSPEEDHKLN